MRILSLIGVLAILGAIAGIVIFFGGFYSVAGTQKDPAIVAWALTHVREASIAHHAPGTPPISLDDPAVIQAGARAFAAHGCVNCHGGPGVPWAKFSEGLNPSPPDLKEVAPGLTPGEIFWVVKNGIRMTGMPGFRGIGDQELWSIAAFLRKLPIVSNEDYKAWSTPPAAEGTAPAIQ
jgi:mono/diheme cytochrome c family protein